MSGLEILGIAASVMQIADLGAELSIKLYGFSRKFYQADKRIDAICQDISVTGSVLRELANELGRDQTAKLCSQTAVDKAGALVNQCKKIFDELLDAVKNGSTKSSLINSIKKRVRFTIFETQIESLRSDLDRLKSSLLVLLNVLILAGQLRNHESLQEVQEQQHLVKVLLQDERSNEARHSRLLQASSTSKKEAHQDCEDGATPPSDSVTTQGLPFQSLNVHPAEISNNDFSHWPYALRATMYEWEHSCLLVQHILDRVSSMQGILDTYRVGLFTENVLKAHWQGWSLLRSDCGSYILAQYLKENGHVTLADFWIREETALSLPRGLVHRKSGPKGLRETLALLDYRRQLRKSAGKQTKAEVQAATKAGQPGLRVLQEGWQTLMPSEVREEHKLPISDNTSLCHCESLADAIYEPSITSIDREIWSHAMRLRKLSYCKEEVEEGADMVNTQGEDSESEVYREYDRTQGAARVMDPEILASWEYMMQQRKVGYEPYATGNSFLREWLLATKTPEYADIFTATSQPSIDLHSGSQSNFIFSGRRDCTPPSTVGSSMLRRLPMQKDEKKALAAAEKYGGNAGLAAKALLATGKEKFRTASANDRSRLAIFSLSKQEPHTAPIALTSNDLFLTPAQLRDLNREHDIAGSSQKVSGADQVSSGQHVMDLALKDVMPHSMPPRRPIYGEEDETEEDLEEELEETPKEAGADALGKAQEGAATQAEAKKAEEEVEEADAEEEAKINDMQGEETESEVHQELGDAEYSDAVAQAMSLPWLSYTCKRHSTVSEVGYPQSADTLCMLSDEAQSEPQSVQRTNPKAQQTSDTASESKLDLDPLHTDEYSAYEIPSFNYPASEISERENFDFDKCLLLNVEDTFASDSGSAKEVWEVAQEVWEVENLLTTFTTLDEDEIDNFRRTAEKSRLTQSEESEMLD